MVARIHNPFSTRISVLGMTTDEKIRLGLMALSVVSAVVVAAHFGHAASVRPPLLEEIGGIGS